MKKQALLLLALICTQASAQPACQDYIDFLLKNKKEVAGLTLLTAVIAYITYKIYTKLNKPTQCTVAAEEEPDGYTQPACYITTATEPVEYDYGYISAPTYYTSPTPTYIQPIVYERPVVVAPVVYRHPVAQPAPYVAPAVAQPAPAPYVAPAPTSVHHPTYFDRLLERQMDILD